MKITFSKFNLVLINISLVILLFFSGVSSVYAEFQYPTISFADCDSAYVEWNVDDYTYSQIETVRISYEGSNASANLSTSLYASLGTVHWWRADVPSWFVGGDVWDVTGYAVLKDGQVYSTINFRRVDCRYKVYLPVVEK